MKDLFFALVCAALSGRNLKRFPALSDRQWNALAALARKQTVLGLFYQGLSHLPQEYALPEGFLMGLVAEVGKIEKQGRKIRQVADDLLQEFQAAGLHPVLMKGPEVARFYPAPLLRECGDIDLYFPPEEFDKAVGMVGKVTPAPDGSVHYKRDGIDIDQHRHYFDIHSRKLPVVPSSEATLLMLSGHILKHCMGVGIGLRQLCDMAMACKGLAVPPERLRQCFRDASLERWNQLLFSFLHQYLGAEPLYDTLPSPEPLIRIILEGGNFGHYSRRREGTLRQSPLRRKLGTAGIILRRLSFSLRYAPKEFLPLVGGLLKGNLTKH